MFSMQEKKEGVLPYRGQKTKKSNKNKGKEKRYNYGAMLRVWFPLRKELATRAG